MVDASAPTPRDDRLAALRVALAPALSPTLFGLRMTAAVCIALFIAFRLQLDNPSWAGTSAAIVCQPVLGASLRKGVFRLIGTVAGAIGAVALTAWFPQDRLGFLLGMALWCGACSFVSTLLRNFAAYAAMLAGYTLVIIASSSIAAPDQVFTLALSRATEIGVGLMCGMGVMSLTNVGASHRRLARDLTDLIAAVGTGVLVQVGNSDASDELFRLQRRALIKRVAALDPMIDQVIGEAPVIGARQSTLRAGVQGLFLALSAWRTLGTHLAYRQPEAARDEARLLGEYLPPDLGVLVPPLAEETTVRGTAARQRDAWLDQAERCRAWDVETPSLRLGADRIASILEGLGRAANVVALLDGTPDPLPFAAVRRSVLPDIAPPLVNALRVFCAVAGGALIWIATSWTAGPTFVTFLAVTVLLQSPRDEAGLRAAVGFGFGMMVTAVVAAVVKFALLPNHEGYVSFVLLVGVALVPLAVMSARDDTSAIFTAAAANFIPLLGPTNVTNYDVAGFANSALAIVGGSLAGIVVLRTIPPLPMRTRTRRLLALTLRDLRRLLDRPGAWSPDAWRSRTFGRLLALPSDAEPVDGSRLLAALTVGLQMLELDRATRDAEGAGATQAVRDALRSGDVAAAKGCLDAMKDAVENWRPALPDRAGRQRLQSAAREVAETLRTYADYFGTDLR